MSGFPAGIPPLELRPNFVNPQTLALVFLVFNIVIMTWMIRFVQGFVIIRVYANFHAP